MNFKKLSLILPLLCLHLNVIAIPVNTESVESYSDSVDSLVEDSLIEDINISGEEVEIIDDFSDNENISTEVLEFEKETITTEVLENEECLTEECKDTSKRILSNMDTSINPCDNFYQFTCGGWENTMKKGKINLQGDQITIATDLSNKINNEIKEILEGEYQVNENLSIEDQEYDKKLFAKLKGLYETCMNVDVNKKYGKEYLINFIDKLNLTDIGENISDADKLTNLLVKFQVSGINTFFKLSPYNDDEISEKSIISIKFDDLLFRYSNISLLTMIPEIEISLKAYISGILTSINEDVDDKTVESIYQLEFSLGNSYLSDMLLSFDEIKPEIANIKTLNEKYPFINWSLYFNKIFDYYGIKDVITDDTMTYNIQPSLLEQINEIFSTIDINTLITFMKWSIFKSPIINNFISDDIKNINDRFTSQMEEIIDRFEQMEQPTNFDFEYGFGIDDDNNDDNIDIYNNTVFNSIKMKKIFKRDEIDNDEDNDTDETEKLLPNDTPSKRSEKCMIYANKIMPFGVGKYFVEKHFTNDLMNEGKQMIENVKEAMKQRIPKMEWLEEETKASAIEKIMKMNIEIGYPSYLLEPKTLYQKYQNVEITDYLSLLLGKLSFTVGYKLGLMNPKDWKMPPHIFNSYYIPQSNTIYVLAAELQSPKYNRGHDYLNYGDVGFIIGHEITHGYDDYGRLFDSTGKKSNWWTGNDNEEFEELTQCFINQYNNITYLIGDELIHIDGETTLPENLADSGGLARAYEAWQLSLLQNPEKAAERNKKLPGLSKYTLDQLFYIAYGQSLCSLETDMMRSNEHSPGIGRINGVVSNSEHFAKTFNCPTNSPMNPKSKCLIW